ncbi:MAG: tRNA epoxyqueuosine(34) reductase QueG [Geminicoccaceae bacterium]|nr:tRNA epoxyqueuosine(34) reductase QueG [Geminicoccaceae bacterium]
MTISTFEDRLRERARTLGIDELRIADADIPVERSSAYRRFIGAGLHGGMDWLARDPERREHPRGLWSEARSAIVAGLNYGPASDPLQSLQRRDRATISVYARNRDYHDVLKGRLKQLAAFVQRETSNAVKVFVDTAPLLEKPLAQRAGLGWQGKHTNLVSRRFGSWLFLGVILTAARLAPDPQQEERCGSCRRCLDICPTDAFIEPFRLDPRRCISYLTIEHKGPIPRPFRPLIGNRIYGCDDCLAVCPWNKYAQVTAEAKLVARADLEEPVLAELARLDDDAFRRLFSGSPVKRIGRARFLRNVMIAIGNSGDPTIIDSVRPHLDDPDPVLRGAAVWAWRRLGGGPGARPPEETDGYVIREWQA